MFYSKSIVPVLFFVSVFFSCTNKNGNKINGALPSCLSKQIEDFDKKQSSNSPVRIDEYMYRDKRVFLFTADCCDQYNTAYDENCNAICSPSGGLDGKGDRKCEDFSREAKVIRKIWPADK